LWGFSGSPIEARNLFDGVRLTVKNRAEILPREAAELVCQSHLQAERARPSAKTQTVQPVKPTQPTFMRFKKQIEQTLEVKWNRWLVWSTTFVLATGVSAIAGVAIALFAPFPKSLAHFFPGGELAAKGALEQAENAGKFFLQYELERPVNILVMGIDRVLEAEPGSQETFDGHSDTLLLLRFDPQDKTLRMLSIPRDTRVFIPETGTQKINDANVLGGAKLAVEVVSETLNELPIDRYVRVTNDAFRQLVDLVGGIEVDVPYPMKYKDATQQLEIDLEPGQQLLNGAQAEQFARFRMDRYGDIGRVQRQQVLLKALRSRLQSPAILPRLPQAVQMMRQYVDTNLSWEETLALVGFGLGLEQSDIKMVLLPGRFSEKSEFEGISYWLMSERERDRILQDYFDQPLLSQTDEQEEGSQSRLRIAIQNTTANPIVGEQAIAYLQERGFPNVYLSEQTPQHPLERTEIVVQQGDTAAAQQMQAVLGLGRIEADSTGDIGSQLTLRLGTDWLTKMGGKE
jgi:polyisoprenyl-teichoic acid--peptidoglycan teichoic acid transferase